MKTFMERLTQEEEEYYLKSYKEGNQRAKEILVERNLRLVAYVVKKYVSTETDRTLEDLISIGTIGLIKAITSFDERKGKLSTYAARCIENEMLMMLRADRKKSREISIYEPIGADKEGNEISLFDVIESDENPVDMQCIINEDIRRLREVMAEVLTEREMEIIEKRYGINGKRETTQREVANELGISRSYVSRIEKRALSKLRNGLE